MMNYKVNNTIAYTILFFTIVLFLLTGFVSYEQSDDLRNALSQEDISFESYHDAVNDYLTYNPIIRIGIFIIGISLGLSLGMLISGRLLKEME